MNFRYASNSQVNYCCKGHFGLYCWQLWNGLRDREVHGHFELYRVKERWLLLSCRTCVEVEALSTFVEEAKNIFVVSLSTALTYVIDLTESTYRLNDFASSEKLIRDLLDDEPYTVNGYRIRRKIGEEEEEEQLEEDDHLKRFGNGPPPAVIESSKWASEDEVAFAVEKAIYELVDYYLVECSCLRIDVEKCPNRMLNISDSRETRVEFSVTNLLPGEEYNCTVRAFYSNITRPSTSFLIMTVPPAPRNFKVINSSAMAFTFRWEMAGVHNDSFEVTANNRTYWTASPELMLRAIFGPGQRVNISVRSVRQGVASQAVSPFLRYSTIISPSKPISLKMEPSFAKQAFRVYVDLSELVGYSNGCGLRYSEGSSWSGAQLQPLEAHSLFNECVWFLPLEPGRRYIFQVWTSVDGVVESEPYEQLLTVAPALYASRIGLDLSTTTNSLQVNWDREAVIQDRKLLGSDAVFNASLMLVSSSMVQASREVPVFGPLDQLDNLEPPDGLTFGNLVAGGCYEVQLFAKAGGVQSEGSAIRAFARTAPLQLRFQLKKATGTWASFYTALPPNVTLDETCELRLSNDGHLRDVRASAIFPPNLPKQQHQLRMRRVGQAITFDLDRLRPYSHYNLTVEQVCGSSELLDPCPQARIFLSSLTFRTAEELPGQVDLFNVTVLAPYSARVTWLAPEHANGKIIAYLITITPSNTAKVPLFETPWNLTVPADGRTLLVNNLTGGGQYKFDVRAINGIGIGPSFDASSNSQNVIITPVLNPPVPSGTPSIVASSIRPSDFMVKFNLSMFSTLHGLLEKYAIMVAEGDEPVDLNTTLSWHDVQNNEVWPVYVALVKSLPPVKRFSATPLTEVLGVDVHCLTLSPTLFLANFGNRFCNGPLRSGRKYRVKLRVYTSPDHYTDSGYSAFVYTAYETSVSVGVILTVVLVFTVLISALMAMAVFVRRRRFNWPTEWAKIRAKLTTTAGQSTDKQPVGGGTPTSGVKGGGKSKSVATPSQTKAQTRVRWKVPARLPDKSTNVGTKLLSPFYKPTGPSSLDDTRPVDQVDFASHVRAMGADSDFLFSEEFEELKSVGRNQSMSAADLPSNRYKNRFTNILPYDHNRVKLIAVDDDDPGSDYINANYISGFNSPREYIATQGPMLSTRGHFWRMVWEQHVEAIVNLTRCIEKGREKCDQYWPNLSKSITSGDIEVVLLNETCFLNWTLRDLLIRKDAQSRRVKQFHFTSWPDFGVPDQPQILVDFIREFRKRVPVDVHPVVVHCSAGVGRSGTFIALDRLLQGVEQGVPIDVYGTVRSLRKERVWMVQTEQQYVFIHHCLLCALESSNVATNVDDMFALLDRHIEMHQNPAFRDDSDDDGDHEATVNCESEIQNYLFFAFFNVTMFIGTFMLFQLLLVQVSFYSTIGTTSSGLISVVDGMEFKLPNLPVCLDAHPFSYAFAVGCVDGSVRLLHLEGDDQSRTISQKWRKRYKAALRGCKFAVDGNSLYVVSKNLALCQQDLQSGSKMRCIQIAHNHAPYSLYPIDQHLIATGDENGVCKIWDWRLDRKPAVAEFHECVDFVSDFVCDVAKTTLLFTSGDATLTAVDLRTMKPICQSEEMHTELLSLVIAMQGKRVLCSSGNGYLEVFNWDQWGTIVERLDTGHQDSVEDLCLLDDRLLASASLDGSVRITHLCPNRFITVLAAHDDGVVALASTHDRRVLASCGHDHKILFTDFDPEAFKLLKKRDPEQRERKINDKSQLQRKQFFRHMICKED
ncbi:Tyrosine-protein phosphatase 10D [Trichinella sp. T6]|nr:Tyrosine-protein phosphatase 10D [Trichinella sp. T6]